MRILGGRTSAAWRRPQPCLLEPALQRAFRGQSLGAVQAAQKDEDQAGAPGRVFAAELQRFVAKVGTLLAVGIAVGVRRRDRMRTDVAKTLQQMTDGARCEAEGRRNRRRGFALAGAELDNLTQWQWGGMRHEQSSLSKGFRDAIHETLPQLPKRGKTSCRYSAAKLLSHFHGKTRVAFSRQNLMSGDKPEAPVSRPPDPPPSFPLPCSREQAGIRVERSGVVFNKVKKLKEVTGFVSVQGHRSVRPPSTTRPSRPHGAPSEVSRGHDRPDR